DKIVADASDVADSWVVADEIAEACHWNLVRKSSLEKPVLDREGLNLDHGADVLEESAVEAVKMLLGRK
ncbi:UNVERIFIED_CONTAM: hypothetical protein HDU68_002431, partial [Siphonaria sp. JEL0065]